MGESERYQDYQSYRRNRRSIFLAQGDNALFWLLTLNVCFFLILLFIRVGYGVADHDNIAFESQVLPNFQLPGRLLPLSEKPWTLLVYNFGDIYFLRLLGNMLWLWSFGSILQGMTGNKKLIPIFIYGGLVGGIFFIAGNYIFPHSLVGANLFGANTGVMALAAATTMLEPDYRIFPNINGGIPLWILFVAYCIIALLGITVGGGPYFFSVLGSAAAGALFVVLLRRGTDAAVWMNNLYQWITNIFTPDKGNKASVKEKVFYNAGNRTPYSRSANITQQRIDDILDKISQEGYVSLTDEEKKILKRAAEEEL